MNQLTDNWIVDVVDDLFFGHKVYLYEIDWGLSYITYIIIINCGNPPRNWDCACRYVVPSLLPGMNAVAEARVTMVQVFFLSPTLRRSMDWFRGKSPGNPHISAENHWETPEARPENPVEWLAYYLLKNNTSGAWLTTLWKLQKVYCVLHRVFFRPKNGGKEGKGQNQSESLLASWVCLKMGYTPNEIAI